MLNQVYEICLRIKFLWRRNTDRFDYAAMGGAFKQDSNKARKRFKAQKTRR